MAGKEEHWSDLPESLGYSQTEDTDWEKRHRQCVRVHAYLTDDDSWDEFQQIKQALEDLHECYPRWRFTVAHMDSDVVLDVPSREEPQVKYLAMVLGMVQEAVRGE